MVTTPLILHTGTMSYHFSGQKVSLSRFMKALEGQMTTSSTCAQHETLFGVGADTLNLCLQSLLIMEVDHLNRESFQMSHLCQ
jgi:hypothetical protein